MNRFIEGGRLTDHHKNKINTEQTLNRLNQIAKKKVMKLDEYSLASFKNYGESCPKYEYDGIERGKVNG